MSAEQIGKVLAQIQVFKYFKVYRVSPACKIKIKNIFRQNQKNFEFQTVFRGFSSNLNKIAFFLEKSPMIEPI